MADRIETNFSYMEGTWAAESMIKKIDKTEYKTVEQAIKVKQELINHFEKDFGFDRNMDEMDSVFPVLRLIRYPTIVVVPKSTAKP